MENKNPSNVDFLLLSATQIEQSLLAKRIKNFAEENHYGYLWRYGQIADKTILLIETGVGQVNTAISLTKALNKWIPKRILQFGIGGAYCSSNMIPGDLVIATKEHYGDAGVITPNGWFGMEEIGFPMINADEQNKNFKNSFYNQIPLDHKYANLIYKNCSIFQKDGGAVFLGPFITIQQCSGIKKIGDSLANRFDAICENMEGAAAAHVAYLNKKSFVEIRAISNQVIDRDIKKWDLKLAVHRIQNAVEKIIITGLE